MPAKDIKTQKEIKKLRGGIYAYFKKQIIQKLFLLLVCFTILSNLILNAKSNNWEIG